MTTLQILIQKEFKQIKRNKFLPKLIIIFPIVVMLIIPWVTTMDVHHVNVQVLDNDRSTLTARMTSSIASSEYFRLRNTADHYDQALKELERGRLDVIVDVPADFEKDLHRSMEQHGAPLPKISVSANAVNSIKGILGMQYVLQSIVGSMQSWCVEQGLPAINEDIVIQNRYNPTLNYRYFMIPAIMIILLIIICGFLPALSMVGEKEKGTIEQINVTPVSKLEFALSKLIPYWIIGLVILTIAMIIARLVYGLAPESSVGSIYLAAILFIITISGLGATIANTSENMQQTMFVMFFFMIVFILMSGLLTPIHSMPKWARDITYAFPPRYFVNIMRSVYLKGAHIADLWQQFAALGGFAVLMNLLAAGTYKKRK